MRRCGLHAGSSRQLRHADNVSGNVPPACLGFLTFLETLLTFPLSHITPSALTPWLLPPREHR